MRTTTTPRFRLCRNGLEFDNCNWFTAADAADVYCVSCRLNRTIPHLGAGDNLTRWTLLERSQAPSDIHPCSTWGWPSTARRRGWPQGLAFDFIEDQRSNPDVPQPFVHTGHANGVITIHVAEADDLYRLRMRREMGEPYRTVLGHFRHESGHYYFDFLIDDGNISSFRALFGDERADYAQALESHYSSGSPGWGGGIHQQLRCLTPVRGLGRDLGPLSVDPRRRGHRAGGRI